MSLFAVTHFDAPQKFDTMFNGGHPFRVRVDGNRFRIQLRNKSRSLVYAGEFLECFVGRSPLTALTSLTGGHGPGYDGNSLLFLVSCDTKGTIFQYVWVGAMFATFRSAHKIVMYMSEVGGSCVTYPWAVDDQMNVLLIEGRDHRPHHQDVVVLHNRPPHMDVRKIMERQQDYTQLATTDPRSVENAQKLNREKEKFQIPDFYYLYWYVMMVAYPEDLHSPLLPDVSSYIPLDNIVDPR